MKEKIYKKRINSWSLLLRSVMIMMMALCFSKVTFAQDNTTFIKVGRYWATASGNGGNFNVSYNSAWFPGDYNVIGNTGKWGVCTTGGSIWLAAQNYNYNGSTIPYSLFIPNPPGPINYNEIVDSLKTATRYGYKTSEVDFEDVTLDWYNDVDPGKMLGNSDQTVTYATRYENGVELKRTIVAFSNQNHDDYVITDLTFIHNGTQTLNDFVIFAQEKENGIERANGRNPGPSSDEGWASASQWLHYYGARPGDSLRVFYEYMADDPRATGDYMGGPVISQSGRLIEPGFQWLSILHASDQPYVGDEPDGNDDPLQPKVTFTLTTQLLPIPDPAGNPDSPIGSDWQPLLEGTFFENQKMSGIPAGTSHRVNNDELGDPDWTAIGAGYAYSAAFTGRYVVFGPYTFEPGQSLHIVYASGESGIGIEKMKEVGNKWYNGTLEDPPGIPDPRTGFFPTNFVFPTDDEIDQRKDRWISTGIDSMHKAANAALWNYKHNYMVPMSPPPPATSIAGYGGFVEIKWSDPEAEALNNFAGYRIMRRISNQDTVFFESVHTTDASDIAADHVFQDSTVRPGASYYYYVQSAVRVAEDDMNALPQNRGKLVYSGRVYNPSIESIEPPRFSQSDLSKIRMVPNPYNINDPLITESYGWFEQRGILFFNLPEIVTIKICTENGDLIQTIEHAPISKDGSEFWDMLTSSQQVIASGIYIVIFEKPDGEVSFQKLVVVR